MEERFKYDLHIHSTCSDGLLSPFELIDLAVEKNIKGISITDHDTIEAYRDPQLFNQAKEKGIDLITGIELSSQYQSETVHILGYCFDHQDRFLQDFCSLHQNHREKRNRLIIEKLAKKGFKISYDDLLLEKNDPKQVLGRPHIARILIRLKHVQTMKEAFERYLGDGKSCYIEPTTPSVEETIEAIHQAKGKAVLAHPHLIKRKKMIKALYEKPFDGIECYYGRQSRKQAESFVAIARKKNWLITGGSDFHGLEKKFLSLGSSFILEEDYQRLIADGWKKSS